MSDAIILEEALREADVVIGAVLVPGALAPRLVTREMLGLMKPRSVIVDVAIDQGGCFETSHPTTHADPVFEVDGILHYCVANMPGAVPVTSTRALTNATLPYVRRLAEQGVDAALAEDPGFARGSTSRTAKSSTSPSRGLRRGSAVGGCLVSKPRRDVGRPQVSTLMFGAASRRLQAFVRRRRGNLRWTEGVAETRRRVDGSASMKAGSTHPGSSAAALVSRGHDGTAEIGTAEVGSGEVGAR